MVELIFHIIASIVESFTGKKETEQRKQRELAWRREQARQARERAQQQQEYGDQTRGLSEAERLAMQRDIEQAHYGYDGLDAPVLDIDAAPETLARPAVVEAPPKAHHHRPHPILQKLRDPDGVREAVILKEVFDRPRALRR